MSISLDLNDANKTFLGHPKGLYVCFATELWERFSFYGMKYLLLLYVTKYHLFTDSAGYDVLGAYAGLVYSLPLIGGLIADRYLGMRKAVVFGALLLVAGHGTMTYEGSEAVRYLAGSVLPNAVTLPDGSILAANTILKETIVIQDVVALRIFFFALALIAVGVGFLKPNISTIVGQLYGDDTSKRDSGFTIFYMGINIGAFLATLLCGWLGENYGWNYGFGAAGVGMLIGLATFLNGQKYLANIAEPPQPTKLNERVFGLINKEMAIYFSALLFVGIIWWLLQHENIVHVTQNSLLIVAIVGIILYSLHYESPQNANDRSNKLSLGLAAFSIIFGLSWAFTGDDAWLGLMIITLACFIGHGFRINKSAEYSRTVVLMCLISSTVVFWSLFEQASGSMTLYADRVVDRTLGDTEVRASMFGSLNAGFIMLLAIPLSLFWIWLGRKGREPSTPVKFGLGIIQAGMGFAALVIGASYPNESGKVAMIWFVLAKLFHTTGELCISPVGLSAVTKLSIHKVVGVSMGTWFLATALSETVATRIGKMAAIDISGVGSADTLFALGTYTELYQFLMWVGFSVGAFMILISPILNRGMRGIH